MLNLIGNAGDMFGKNITFFENKNKEGYYLVLICEDTNMIIKTNLLAEEYINCPYYTRAKNILEFNKPALFYVPEYEFEGEISKTNLVKTHIFGNGYNEFKYVFGDDYLYTGKIIKATASAIKYWNMHENLDKRLAVVILNYIIEHEFSSIKNFMNRKIETFHFPILPAPDEEKRPIFRCEQHKSLTGNYSNNIMGPYKGIFKMHIHNGIYYKSDGDKCLCHCKFSIDASMNTGLVYHVKWSTHYKEIVHDKNKIYLRKPKALYVPGAPWYISVKYDMALNGISCHIDVMRARGGGLFKKIKLEKKTTVSFDPKYLIMFVYFRSAPFKNVKEAKKELLVAVTAENSDYKNFIYNYFIENNIYYYYKFNEKN